MPNQPTTACPRSGLCDQVLRQLCGPFAQCWALFLPILGFLVVGCAGQVHEDTPITGVVPVDTLPTLSDKSAVPDVILIDGSELIAPITEAIAKEFASQNPQKRVVVESNGSARGFERLCDGDIHINEPVLWATGDVYERCRQHEVEWIELPIARIGSGNFVNGQNDFVRCLTLEQNRQIWSLTDAARTWSDLDPTWPDEEIHRYAWLYKEGKPFFDDSPSYEEVEWMDSFDSRELGDLDALAGDPFGIGFFMTVYYSGNEGKVNPVAMVVDEQFLSTSVYGEGCNSLDPWAAEAGHYPIWGGPVNVYVSRQALRESRDLQEFLNFYMENAAAYAREYGLFALSAEEYEDNRRAIHRR